MASRKIKFVFLAAAALAAIGCQNMNNTQSGAVVGTGLGAATGAIIGEASGHAGGGALIGAAAGALGGALVGNAADAREERDAAVAQAQHARMQSAAIAQAVTESQVVAMAHHNVADSVIITELRTKGCNWDGSAEAVIRLKQQGVSDQVIQAMQNTGLHAPAGTVVVAAPPPPPGPYYGPPPAGGVVVVGPGYYRPWRPRPYWGPRYYW